jgi:hypothetical protein
MKGWGLTTQTRLATIGDLETGPQKRTASHGHQMSPKAGHRCDQQGDILRTAAHALTMADRTIVSTSAEKRQLWCATFSSTDKQG